MENILEVKRCCKKVVKNTDTCNDVKKAKNKLVNVSFKKVDTTIVF